MYKKLALFALSGILLAACDSKTETAAPAAAKEEAPAVVEEAVAVAEEAAPAAELTAGEIGVASCDEYISKYKACLEKMPAESREAAQAGLTQMVDAWKQTAEVAPDALDQGCKMAIDSSRASMEASGCEW